MKINTSFLEPCLSILRRHGPTPSATALAAADASASARPSPLPLALSRESSLLCRPDAGRAWLAADLAARACVRACATCIEATCRRQLAPI